MSNTREPGYYWVKCFGSWGVARWVDIDMWAANGILLPFEDVEEINETRILSPDEKQIKAVVDECCELTDEQMAALLMSRVKK